MSTLQWRMSPTLWDMYDILLHNPHSRLYLLYRDDYRRRPKNATAIIAGVSGQLYRAGREPGTAWYTFDRDTLRPKLLIAAFYTPHFRPIRNDWLAAMVKPEVVDATTVV